MSHHLPVLLVVIPLVAAPFAALVNRPRVSWALALGSAWWALYAALGPPASGAGAHRLDVGGACVSGEHPAVLEGGSAATLAQCMLTLLADAEAARPPPRGL